MWYSGSAISQEVPEKKASAEKLGCAVGYVSLRGVCSNPVPVASRDFTAATLQDSPLNSVSLEFLERLRK